MRALLEQSSLRTHDPRKAALFYVPLWEVASSWLGECEGTSHTVRMSRAAEALSASPHFKARDGRAAGFDHVLVTTGWDEMLCGSLMHARERFGPQLSPLLANAIFGRDHAYSPVKDKAAAVGSCTVEVPYVSNPHADLQARIRAPRHTLLAFQGSDTAW
jgi:hypothetical protein